MIDDMLRGRIMTELGLLAEKPRSPSSSLTDEEYRAYCEGIGIAQHLVGAMWPAIEGAPFQGGSNLQVEQELLPCPFCGGEAMARAHITDSSPRVIYWVRCRWCAAEGPWKKSASSAIASWNRRRAVTK